MQSEEYDNNDDYSRQDKPENNNGLSQNDAQKNKLFHLVTKYFLLSIAIYVSLSIIMGSNNLFIAVLFVGGLWLGSILFYKKRNIFYKKRENYGEWNFIENPISSEKPNIKNEPKSRLSTLDEESSRPLNSYEKDNWDSITNTLLNENFDVLKPFNKKKKKDK